MKPHFFHIAIVAVVISFVDSVNVHATIITNPGFETFEFVGPAIASTFGDWEGDRSAIVKTENGITPLEGIRMLRFDFTFVNTAGSTSADIHTLIDVSAYSALISSGFAKADATAFFNRVSVDAQTDTRFLIQVRALSGLPSGFPSGQLANGFAEVFTDNLASTWQAATAELLLPSNTSYLAIIVSATEDVFDDVSFPEFDGHYVDNVSLNITAIPEPASIAIWSVIGGIGLIAGWRKHRRKTAA